MKHKEGFNVSAWGIYNPVGALMIFVLLCLMGGFGFWQMKISQFPDLQLPNVIVSATLPGASSSQLEDQVAKKIEDNIANIEGLKNTYTSISNGTVIITAEFRLEKNAQEALDEVRSRVDALTPEFPENLTPPLITKQNLSGLPILTYAVIPKDIDPVALSNIVDKTLIKELLRIRGVGSAVRVGGVDEQIQVQIDEQKAQLLGLTAAQVSGFLRQVLQDQNAGTLWRSESTVSLRTLSAASTPEELLELPVPTPSGSFVPLKDLAYVQKTISPVRSGAFFNGTPVVALEITRSKGAGEVQVGEATEAFVAQWNKDHPEAQLQKTFDFVEPVQSDYKASLMLLYEGAGLAVIVVLAFLRNWRATWICAVALPLSVIPAFAGMYFLGFSINVITLLALSLVVGILVDDAIVEVENIERHLHMGKSPIRAAIDATEEIGLAVVATTFTLIAVFLPTAFMSGIAGRFFVQFGWSAALAVFASLLVARLLTPMMAAYGMRAVKKHQAPDGILMRSYLRFVRVCTRFYPITLIFACIIFALSIALIPLLPTGFIPSDNLSQTQVVLELDPGSTYEQTVKKSQEAQDELMKNPAVRTVYTAVGAGTSGADPFSPQGASEARRATLTILLTKRQERPKKSVVEEQIRKQLESVSGVRYKVGLGGTGEKFVFMLVSDDAAKLAASAPNVYAQVQGITGIGGVNSSAILRKQELQIRVDWAQASKLGLTNQDVSGALRIASVGEYPIIGPKLNTTEEQLPVVIKTLSDKTQADAAWVESFSFYNGKKWIDLSEFASVDLISTSAQVDRFNRQRSVLFEIELSGAPLGDIKTQLYNLPSVKSLPQGVKLFEVGDAEVMQELFESFALAMLTGVLCIYMVLVLLFKSFLQPVTILMALPLSIGGAFVALLLTGQSFSMPSLIGLVMLMGVATKNSILLVEYASAAREKGMNRIDALVDACHKRARPIIMTSIAMGAGMMPIALQWGEADGSFRAPMAIAVIGGLITSTFLSLVIIPAFYMLIDSFGSLVMRLFPGWGSTKDSSLSTIPPLDDQNSPLVDSKGG